MSLTKAAINNTITPETGLPKHLSEHAVGCLLKIIKDTFAPVEDILISSFGKFGVSNKTERRGRNPATGVALMLPARRVVTFRCSGKLRDRCHNVANKTGD